MAKEKKQEEATVKAVSWAHLNLRDRLFMIQRDMPAIAKSGKRTGNVSYEYLTHDDVAQTVVGVCNKWGVLATTAWVDGSTEFMPVRGDRKDRDVAFTTCTIELRFHGFGLPVDEDVVALGRAAALDFEDKGDGKSQSYAKKVALLNFFLVPQGEDKERDEVPAGSRGMPPPPPPHPPAQPSQTSGRKPPEQPKPQNSASMSKVERWNAGWGVVKTLVESQTSKPNYYKITKPQLARLVSDAASNGWNEGGVRKAVKGMLGMEVEDLPSGKTVGDVTAIFKNIQPKSDAPPAASEEKREPGED